MKKLLSFGAIIAALTLTACGGGDSGGGDSTTAAQSNPGGDTVAVQQLGDAGSVLVDSSGRALYASDQETGGKVLCTGACESFWMPVTVSGGQPQGSAPGQLATVKRPDGSEQVTYNGKLLYSFTEEGPGEVTGDGFKDAFDDNQFSWHAVRVADGGSPSSSSSGSPSPSY